jgi:hypothetical protein
MSKEKPNAVAPHDSDVVVVEVIHPTGVLEDGKKYGQGATLTMLRGHAERLPKYFRVLMPVKRVNDPDPEARFEQPAKPPLVNTTELDR